MYKSGLRISEVLGYPGRPEQVISLPDGPKVQKARDPIQPLKKDDINFARHDIRILHTKSQEPQTRGLHPSIDDSLHRWIDVRKDLGLNGRHALFCTLKGKPLSEQYVRALLGRLKEKASVERRVYPHGVPLTNVSPAPNGDYLGQACRSPGSGRCQAEPVVSYSRLRGSVLRSRRR